MSGFMMFGTFTAHPGKRDELLRVMLDNQTDMEGCELYLVGPAEGDRDAVCVVERWRDEAAHTASLENEQVRATIALAMPLIADMRGTKFTPVGGIGL